MEIHFDFIYFDEFSQESYSSYFFSFLPFLEFSGILVLTILQYEEIVL